MQLGINDFEQFVINHGYGLDADMSKKAIDDLSIPGDSRPGGVRVYSMAINDSGLQYIGPDEHKCKIKRAISAYYSFNDVESVDAVADIYLYMSSTDSGLHKIIHNTKYIHAKHMEISQIYNAVKYWMYGQITVKRVKYSVPEKYNNQLVFMAPYVYDLDAIERLKDSQENIILDVELE